MPPGLSHALIAAAMQGAVAWPLLSVIHDAVAVFSVAALFPIGFYAGRERRQSEEWFGSNRIPPWRWRPRALRDLGWPVMACCAMVVAILLASGRAW
jgi:hypothetical protein